MTGRGAGSPPRTPGEDASDSSPAGGGGREADGGGGTTRRGEAPPPPPRSTQSPSPEGRGEAGSLGRHAPAHVSPNGKGTALPAATIAELYRAACLAELDALKVGNVHAFAAGHRMEVADFVTSAEVSAPALAMAGAPVGARVRGGVSATMAAVGQNTNLGILLLCAPLALAAEADGPIASALDAVLDRLDAADGAAVFAAIRLAAPGGLGSAARHDVTAEGPSVPLGDAMAEAAPRDRIARAYATGFADLFEIGLPALAQARAAGLAAPWTTTAIHIAYLTRVPDSHVARKFGPERAETVRAEAEAALARLDLSTQPLEALLTHDRRLKEAGLNPGTSADFTVATLFLDALAAARGETV